ncbi:polyprotein [Plasmopara halstedii]|uniref:Polyprotein n=1 Tax=Plasmopara halstedii TaxID=4781 RepID=A0A0P1B3B0_PLAHL|nr:polyprotein [Plasmopara halstedii]CEG49223.1 polyprotein [Plasmopara halstedii]|eukprot:XP_024585592.1 polyprotein [Plasmopara halstedii]
MAHLMRLEELYLKLSAAGECIDDNEKLVVLLGSLPEDFDAMVRIIEATSCATLLDAKEMLRQEHEKLMRRDKKGAAFKAGLSQRNSRPARNGDGRYENSRNGYHGRRNGNGNGGHGVWKNHAPRRMVVGSTATVMDVVSMATSDKTAPSRSRAVVLSLSSR